MVHRPFDESLYVGIASRVWRYGLDVGHGGVNVSGGVATKSSAPALNCCGVTLSCHKCLLAFYLVLYHHHPTLALHGYHD